MQTIEKEEGKEGWEAKEKRKNQQKTTNEINNKKPQGDLYSVYHSIKNNLYLYKVLE